MSALARETGAINLGQGFSEMEEPAELLEAARRAPIDRPNQYPPMRGPPQQDRAWRDFSGEYSRVQGAAMSSMRLPNGSTT